MAGSSGVGITPTPITSNNLKLKITESQSLPVIKKVPSGEANIINEKCQPGCSNDSHTLSQETDQSNMEKKDVKQRET